MEPDVLEQFLREVGLEPEGLVVDDDPVQVLHQSGRGTFSIQGDYKKG